MTRRSRDAWPDLAIFGGAPLFSDPLLVGRPNIGDRARLLERLNDILDRRWLSNNGVYVQEFERRLCDITGAKHCIPICNGTRALEIALTALGMQGEVIVPAFTFVATPHAVAWQGSRPVFADVDPSSYTIDPASVEALITERTTGIIGVHLWGRSCDVDALEEIAARHRLKLMFDAAHAFGSSYKGTPIGGFGDAEVFSFHATKFVNSFEGGAIATNDDGVAERVRLMTNFGFVDFDQVEALGTNGKMAEPCAAMGLTSLESMSDFIEVNRQNYAAYAKGLSGIPGVSLGAMEGSHSNFQYIVLIVDEDIAGLNRDTLHRILGAENIGARRYFYPGCHRMEPYRTWLADTPPNLPVTDRLVSQTLCLPTGTAVSVENVEQICELVKLSVSCAPEIIGQMMQRAG